MSDDHRVRAAQVTCLDIATCLSVCFLGGFPTAREIRAKAMLGHLFGLQIHNIEMVQGPEAGNVRCRHAKP